MANTPSAVRSGSDSTRCVPSTAVAPSSSLIAGRNFTPASSSSFAAFHACMVDHAERRAAVAADEALRLSTPAAASRAACISVRRISACVPVRKTTPSLAAEVVGEAVVGAGEGLRHGASVGRG